MVHQQHIYIHQALVFSLCLSVVLLGVSIKCWCLEACALCLCLVFKFSVYFFASQQPVTADISLV